MRRNRVLVEFDKSKRYIFHFSKPALLKRNSSCAILSERVSRLILPLTALTGLLPAVDCPFLALPLLSGQLLKTSSIKSCPPKRRLFINLNASRPSRLARFLKTAFQSLDLENVKQIRLYGKLFFNTKSLALWRPDVPRNSYHLPLPKTSRISFLFFKCSSRLKRKEFSLTILIRLFLVGNRKFNSAFCPAAF